MPKYWGKQIFAHGRFPEVGQKQKTEKKKKEKKEKKKEERKLVITMAKLRMAHTSHLGQFHTDIYLPIGVFGPIKCLYFLIRSIIGASINKNKLFGPQKKSGPRKIKGYIINMIRSSNTTMTS